MTDLITDAMVEAAARAEWTHEWPIRPWEKVPDDLADHYRECSRPRPRSRRPHPRRRRRVRPPARRTGCRASTRNRTRRDPSMTDPMTAAEWIAKRRELLDAATEGPWDHYRPHPNYRAYQVSQVPPEGHLGECVSNCDDVQAAENAEFIADARTSLPRALDALEAVLAEHERGHFGPILGFRCRRCITGSAGYAVPSPSPCVTVTAIESALRGDS